MAGIKKQPTNKTFKGDGDLYLKHEKTEREQATASFCRGCESA